MVEVWFHVTKPLVDLKVILANDHVTQEAKQCNHGNMATLVQDTVGYRSNTLKKSSITLALTTRWFRYPGSLLSEVFQACPTEGSPRAIPGHIENR